MGGLVNALTDPTIRAVVLCPGIYLLNQPLIIYKENFVVFGMGMANLVAPPGQSAILVTADGVRVSGLLIEPEGKYDNSDPLLVWGRPGKKSGSPSNPGFMYDIFTRVGRFRSYQQTSVSIQVQVNMDYVVLDNLWLWRGDHDKFGNVYNENNPADIGIEINGDYVHAYGIASEHNLKEQVKWNGNHGWTAFFQAEFPYDVKKYDTAAFSVASSVTHFEAHGLGAWCYFRDHPVIAPAGISTPTGNSIIVENVATVWLNGNDQSQIQHVINNQGDALGNGIREGQCMFAEMNLKLAAVLEVNASTTTGVITQVTDVWDHATIMETSRGVIVEYLDISCPFLFFKLFRFFTGTDKSLTSAYCKQDQVLSLLLLLWNLKQFFELFYVKFLG